MDRLKHPNFEYIATTTGGTKKKRTIILLSELSTTFDKTNCYRTWCRYENDIVEYQKNNDGRLKGFISKHYSDFFPIDIDNNEYPEQTQKTCMELIIFLEQQYEVPIESIRIYFSGSKGFHLEIPTDLFGDIQPSNDLNVRFKEIAKSFQFKIDLSIYNRNALWRLSNSINSKSKLYKIPITYKELINLSYEALKELAKEPRYDFIYTAWDEWEPIDSLVELWNNSEIIIKSPSKNQVPKTSNKKLNLNQPGAVEGERNFTAFNLALKFNSQGVKVNEAKDYIVNEWNPSLEHPEKDIYSLKNTVESAYGYNHYDSGSIGINKHLRTDPYYNSFDPAQKTIYVHLLITLNEVDKLAFNKYPVKPNQRIFSYKKLPAEIGVGKQRVRTVINKLIKWGRITVKTIKDEKGMDDCSLITFLCIDLTQFLTHPTTLTKDGGQLTQELTTTNIKTEGSKKS